MKKYTEVIGLLIAGAALVVAVLSWLIPFSPVGSSPASRLSTTTAYQDTIETLPIPNTTPTIHPASIPPTSTPEPRRVMWGPFYGYEPGICVATSGSCESQYGGKYIPWLELEKEVQREVLPQLPNIPPRSTIALPDTQSEVKESLPVLIIDPSGKEIGHIWFDLDPTHSMSDTGGWYGGLVLVGSNSIPFKVWATFQRYSDGSYRKINN